MCFGGNKSHDTDLEAYHDPCTCAIFQIVLCDGCDMVKPHASMVLVFIGLWVRKLDFQLSLVFQSCVYRKEGAFRMYFRMYFRISQKTT